MALRTPGFLSVEDYTALEDRNRFITAGNFQQGVLRSSHYNVVQRATGGANMSVDVGLGYAAVPANSAGNVGLYTVQNDATSNVVVTAADATNPRIDQIILTVNDSVDGGAGSDIPVLSCVRGTATSGATLANRTGAAALPSNSLRLADVLVGAGVTSIVNANIQDRRSWARGAFYTNNTTLTTTVTTSPGTVMVGTSINVEIAVQQPIIMRWHGAWRHTNAAANCIFEALMDGAVNGSLTLEQDGFTTSIKGGSYGRMLTPTAGRHSFGIAARSSSAGTLTISGGFFSFEEVLRDSTSN